MNRRHIFSFSRILFGGILLFYSSAYTQELDDIIRYYNQGDFKSAQEELKTYLESNPSDFEALYYAGKLESNAEKSVEYLKRVWEGAPNSKEEEAGLELSLYYQAEGLNDSVLNLCSKFQKIFPQSPFLPQILWLESQAFFSAGKIEQALKGFRKIIELYPSSSWAAWAQLGIAEAYYSQGYASRSIKEYNKVVDKYAETEAFPSALAGISRAFENTGEKDKSVLYLNLYKEKFPEGIDVESQILTEEIIPEKNQGEAEKLTGTVYTVQIGVFSNQENAANLMKRLKSRGYDPEESYRTIQDKKYYVIQVGFFESLPAAQKLREKLEREEGETYRVVIK